MNGPSDIERGHTFVGFNYVLKCVNMYFEFAKQIFLLIKYLYSYLHLDLEQLLLDHFQPPGHEFQQLSLRYYSIAKKTPPES